MRLLILLGLAVFTITGCSTETPPVAAESKITDTDTEEGNNTADSSAAEPAETQMEDEKEAEMFVIDVRSKEEWDGGHVEIAAHIPHTEIAERIGEVTTDKNAKIVVYCAVGGRAGKAKEVLEGMGYTAVENGGGYDDVKDKY